jgi:hypothetical protein
MPNSPDNSDDDRRKFHDYPEPLGFWRSAWSLRPLAGSGFGFVFLAALLWFVVGFLNACLK